MVDLKKDKNIKISVIIPVYNCELYIKQCLDSIVNQTIDDIEIICIDDGSTDDSLKIINNYANHDGRIKVISIDNHGQGFARNLGLKEAKGEFISFVDADDWMDLDSYEILYDKIKNNDLDILFFKAINYIDSSGNLVETDLYNYQCFIDNLDEGQIFSNSDTQDFLFDITVYPGAKLYKNRFLQENNILYPEGIIFEDNYFFYNAYLNAERMSFINKCFCYRRRHESSTTQTFNEKIFNIVPATNLILDLFEENSWYDVYKKDLINHTFSMIDYWFNKTSIDYREDFYHIIKNDFYGYNKFKLDFKDYLKDEYKLIFELFFKNDYFLDFISEYNLNLVEFSNVIESKNQKYKISIIIPIYNNENIIHRTLMSIIHQSLGLDCIEVILINDKSTDSTAKVINEYADYYSNFKAIHLKNNTGAAGTPRNIGVREAKADYVMFLDHDDFFEVNALEILYDEMLKRDADIVFGTYDIVNNYSFFHVFYENEKHGYFKSIECNERFVAVPPPSIWTKLFKKDFIIKNNLLFPPILGEDAIFMNKAFLCADGISYIRDELICYHDLNDESTTNNVSLNYLLEGLTSEKYLFNLFKSLDKEYCFKYRCEGNVDFFLNQFSKSDLTDDEIKKVFPIFHWFIEKSNSYGILSNTNNRMLYNYFLNEDVSPILQYTNLNTNNSDLNEELLNTISNLLIELKSLNSEAKKEINSLMYVVEKQNVEKKELLNRIEILKNALVEERKNLEKNQSNGFIKEINNKLVELGSLKGWISNKF